MSKKVIIVEGVKDASFDLDELCAVCDISPQFIVELVEYAVLSPVGDRPEVWTFNMLHLRRVKTVLRLQRDLEVNMAGAALAIELLEEMEELRAKADLLERLSSKALL